jgi:hypothetical protein
MSSTWNTTITELLGIFRDGLIALLPIAERAHIPWKEHEAYDDWDAIATTLFEQVVLRSVRWSLAENQAEQLSLAPYDMAMDSYSSLSTLVIGRDGRPGETLVFCAFATQVTPFDTVKCRAYDPVSGAAIGEATVPWHGARAHLRYHTSSGDSRIVDALCVAL